MKLKIKSVSAETTKKYHYYYDMEKNSLLTFSAVKHIVVDYGELWLTCTTSMPLWRNHVYVKKSMYKILSVSKHNLQILSITCTYLHIICTKALIQLRPYLYIYLIIICTYRYTYICTYRSSSAAILGVTNVNWWKKWFDKISLQFTL